MEARGRGWTNELRECAVALRAEGKNNAEIGRVVGRSRRSVHAMFIRLEEGKECRPQVGWTKDDIKELKRLRATGMQTRKIAEVMGRPTAVVQSKLYYIEHSYIPPKGNVSSVSIPPDTEREWRERRYLSHTNLTAAFCGDPLPGYSALERRT